MSKRIVSRIGLAVASLAVTFLMPTELVAQSATRNAVPMVTAQSYTPSQVVGAAQTVSAPMTTYALPAMTYAAPVVGSACGTCGTPACGTPACGTGCGAGNMANSNVTAPWWSSPNGQYARRQVDLGFGVRQRTQQFGRRGLGSRWGY